jgi:hypothetical protein
MIYLVTIGEYSDYTLIQGLDGPDGLDTYALVESFNRSLGIEPYRKGEKGDYKRWQGQVKAVSGYVEKLIQHLIQEHGCRKVWIDTIDLGESGISNDYRGYTGGLKQAES